MFLPLPLLCDWLEAYREDLTRIDLHALDNIVDDLKRQFLDVHRFVQLNRVSHNRDCILVSDEYLDPILSTIQLLAIAPDFHDSFLQFVDVYFISRNLSPFISLIGLFERNVSA
jgi:hypothetical protein